MITEERKIEYLKEILYSMDKLTEKQNDEARNILKTKINGKKISTIERLKLMISIKEKIVGTKKRKFYVEGGLFFENGRITKPEVYAQLINEDVHLTGGIETILKPSYNYFDEEMIDEYKSDHGFDSMGTWVITKNFKTLRFDYDSDKRWKDDKSYNEIID